jgi:thiol:disulfide interchange protein DsbD
VVVSFLALAGLLLALRAGGEQLGWGFQLQSPGCSWRRWRPCSR